MDEVEVIPEVKQILGALLFAAKTPMTADDLRKILQQVAEVSDGPAKDFGEISLADVRSALDQLKADLLAMHGGVHLSEVANGYRLQNDVSCGPWLRQMLERGKGNRLSKPALETLAIIAYRQPVMRSEIEAVRGVAVDQILRNLLDMQLVRITGRSELPGRPWLFGTTQKFLEYFGLKNVQDLPGVEELRRMEQEKEKTKQAPDVEEPASVEQVESTETPGEDKDKDEAEEVEEEDEEEFDDDDDEDEEDEEDEDENDEKDEE